MPQYVIVTICGCLLGRIAAGWAADILADMNSGGLATCPSCKAKVPSRKKWFSITPIRCSCGAARIYWPLVSGIGLGLLFLLVTWLLVGSPNCQGVHEVRPSWPMLYTRLPFHLTLVFLLWVTVLTDLLDYIVPDEVIWLGIFIAVAAAFGTGELQMIHFWVNWDEALLTVNGPYLPEWMKNHQHLHGLAWSLTGLVTGASVTWLVRWLSEKILGYPALGLGDVTLMAMIGAFLGWQPTLCVLAIAPLMGIVIATLVRIITGRSFVAFGPYLACSAVFVLCTWRWLWADLLSLRDIFSNMPTVLMMIAGSFGVLIVLLIFLRVFRAVPAKR